MSANIRIEFEDIPLLTSNKYVEELKKNLKRLDNSIEVDSEGDEGNQDAGSILTILLGAPSVVIIAKGIADYLKRRNNARISIKRGDDSIVASGIDSKTAHKITELLTKEAK